MERLLLSPSMVIGVAIVLAMIVPGMAGAAIPTILSALGQEPAATGFEGRGSQLPPAESVA